MTFRNAPLAIDGALIDSALLRVNAAATGRRGVDGGKSLKVVANGTGLIVREGIGFVPNHYKQVLDETYIATNIGDHLVDASEMPPASGSARSHLVALVIGDPEFDQTGHPFMAPTDPPDGEETTFQYVRIVVIQDVPSNTRTFAELGLSYPGLELARLDQPAGVISYTNGHLVDLRKLPQPRSEEVVETFVGASDNGLNGQGGTPGAWENWPNVAFIDAEVPDWATVVKIHGFIEGVHRTGEGGGKLRVGFIDGGSTTVTNVNEDSTASSRTQYNVGGKISIPENYRGTTRRIRMEGTPNNETSKGFIRTQSSTSAYLRLRFEEGLD